MACPFFMPTKKSDELTWPHPQRLPLGDGWMGQCTASVDAAVVPSSVDLQEFCNLGYAKRCARLPDERAWDAVRFCISPGRTPTVTMCYVGEREHLPVEHGTLEFDLTLDSWTRSHKDERVQRMAECYLMSYLSRRPRRRSVRPDNLNQSR